MPLSLPIGGVPVGTPVGAPVGVDEFAALMDWLGPFEPAPRLAVGVSGGADSFALALLAHDWARARGGSVTGLIVDHGLRPESAAEAALAAARLQAAGIPAHLLRLHGLAPGHALAARARAARHAALEAACAEAGILHLLLGHHAGDQAETIALRLLDRSGPAGLAGMAALVETAAVRRLRPLLRVPPGRLRATLRARGLAWVEDPSNADPRSQRARLRTLRGDREGNGPVTAAAGAAARARGLTRAAAERNTAAELAARAAIHPEGFALLSPGPIGAAALAALLRMVAGRAWQPAQAAVARLAASPAPATLGGARLLPAGRLAPGHLLVVREAAAMSPPVAALLNAVWDGRFRLAGKVPENLTLGALGKDAATLRRHSRLPASVLSTLPALRRGEVLFSVPHLQYSLQPSALPVRAIFTPPGPAACAPFTP